MIPFPPALEHVAIGLLVQRPKRAPPDAPEHRRRRVNARRIEGHAQGSDPQLSQKEAQRPSDFPRRHRRIMADEAATQALVLSMATENVPLAATENVSLHRRLKRRRRSQQWRDAPASRLVSIPSLAGRFLLVVDYVVHESAQVEFQSPLWRGGFCWRIL